MKKLVFLITLFTISSLALIGFFLKIHANLEKETLQKPPTPLNSKKLFEEINKWRKSEGLMPYIESDELCNIASDRANDVPILDHHVGFIQKYSNNSNYPYMVMQENLSGLEPSEEIVLKSWLSSPPHRQTLEKSYTHSCVVCDKQCVQIFSSFER